MGFSPNSQQTGEEGQNTKSRFRKAITVVTWIELILGLSAILSAIFLNPRVPLPLYAFYGVYLGAFLWLLYYTSRATYLQSGQLNYAYWICGGCTLATVGVVLLTLLTAPNTGEIVFISTIIFLVSLVLFPFISAVFYCFLRGNFIMPEYMRGRKSDLKQGTDEPDSLPQVPQDYNHRTDV